MRPAMLARALRSLSRSACLLIIGAGTAFADEAQDIRAVLALDQARAQALLARDVATIDRITADDYTHFESSGKVRTKTSFIESLRAGEATFDSFDIEENNVRIYGNTAICVGRYSNRIRLNGNLLPFKKARHTRVYVKQNGEWKVVAHQAIEIP